MTWADYLRISHGHTKKELEKSKKYRMQLASILKVKPKDLWELPGDNKITGKVVNQEYIEDLKKKWNFN